MKKVILSVAVFSLMAACNKETKVDESTTSTTSDSIMMDDSAKDGVAVVPFKKVEWSPEETSKMLGNQNNDTLYVTNFFATWCGPCIKEFPYFKAKMKEMDGQAVKFTFVSLDQKSDWTTVVPDFVQEQGLSGHVVLLDGQRLPPEFFAANFKNWDGGAIPFTMIRKGDKTDETLGSMSEKMLSQKLNSFK